MKSLKLLCSTLLVTLPVMGGSFEDKTGASAVATVTEDAAPIVQVRDYWQSAVVTVVAWDADDAAFGLRTSVTRTGKLVGGNRAGDHRLYMTPYLVRDMGGFAHAAVDPKKGELLNTGWQRDDYACFYGKTCSPMTTVGIRIPDSLLRENREGLEVMFYPRVQDPWSLYLRRELISAYLIKVDSVVKAMRRAGTT
jgi:hypothetical protein